MITDKKYMIFYNTLNNEILNVLNNSFFISIYSLIIGLIPGLFWLWFWMHEDKHKEPKKIIILTFILGMFGLLISFIIQKIFILIFNINTINSNEYINFISLHPIVNLIFVIIEEFIKFICAYVIFFRTKLFDEPIDAFIYLMTAAIGFSSMENSLYVIKPLIENNHLDLLINTNIRFIGANIVHIISSGILGLFIGLSYCKKPFIKEIYIWFGLTFAIFIHWIFNIFLISYNKYTYLMLFLIWFITIFLIFFLEKIKQIKCNI